MIRGLNKMSVRFFIFDEDENDIQECNETDFLACEYPISYERHTIFANGVDQVCLTKMPQF